MPSVVEIPCPECEKTLKVPETVFGKKIKCKYCGHAFVVEDPAEGGQKKPTKPGVKPSKPGGAAVKPKKEEPKPESKPAEPAAPYKFQDDDDDEGAKPNPLGLIAEDEVARCPFCAKELDPPDAKVCLHCGFNNETRVRAESKKVWAPDASDWMNHLGPGIVALLLFIGLLVLDIVCWVNMRDWMTGTFLQKDDKDAQGEIAFYVKPGAFITFIIAATILPMIGTARFAIKRLFIENQPQEKVKK
jgi:ribosomal protein L37E